MNKFKILAILCMSILVASCGNPGDISDKDFAKYQELGAPKILYSCKRVYLYALACTLEGSKTAEECVYEAIKSEAQVGYTAGIGVGATYNKLLTDAKDECDGGFKVLASKE